MWSYFVNAIIGIISSFVSGLKFCCTFTFGTKEEVDKTVTKVKEEQPSETTEK